MSELNGDDKVESTDNTRRLADMTSLTVALEDEGCTSCCLMLFSGVENTAELRQLILKGQVEASVIKPELVVAPFQVVVAVNRAVRARAARKMVTRSVYAEVLFNLSTTKNITDSLKTFGLGETDREVLAVVLGREGEVEAQAEKITGQIKGQLTPISELGSMMKEARVREVYKINEAETEVGSLLDGVVSRMACKDFLAL